MKRSIRALGTLFVVALAVALTSLPGAAQPLGSTTPADYHESTVLVGFDDGVSAADRAGIHVAIGGQVANRMQWLNLDVVSLPDALAPVAASAAYERQSGVAYAHPNWTVQLLGQPNDLLFDDLWGLHNTGQPVTASFVKGVNDADVDAPEGWDSAFGASNFENAGGTRVGILDTGIDLTHADLSGKTKACASATAAIGIVVEGVCSDDNLHGTHVAGTIGAVANNGIGVAGVAPNADFAIFKGLNAAGVGFYADIIAGIRWLYSEGQAKVISMSIGGPQDDDLDKALSEAYNSGTLLIAAAGNDGDDTGKELNWPAAHPDVVSVAATNARDERAWFSNCNADVEVAAPGVDIWSTIPGNGYAPLDGTSMATPHVSGVAALIISEKGLNNVDARKQLLNSTDDLGPNGRDNCFGYGRVNLATALAATNTTEPAPSDPGGIAGTVSEFRTKVPIANATVDCGAGGKATTDANGYYSIGSVPPGSYTCTASHPSYRSKSRTVTVESGTVTTADFVLRKK